MLMIQLTVQLVIIIIQQTLLVTIVQLLYYIAINARIAQFVPNAKIVILV